MTDLDSRLPSNRRSRRKPIWIVVAVVVVIGVAVGLALFQPWRIFTRSTVDEALPVVAAQAVVPPATTFAIEPGEISRATSPAATESAPVEPAEATAPVAEQQATVAEAAPAPVAVLTEPVVLAAGDFVDGEHATSGTANILQLPDGSRFVRLEGFSTSDGPDVHVWLTDQQAGGDDWGKYDDGRSTGLGALKGTDGNQNYPIPADADVAGLSSVVIWCDRFNVAFGSAAIAL